MCKVSTRVSDLHMPPGENTLLGQQLTADGGAKTPGTRKATEERYAR